MYVLGEKGGEEEGKWVEETTYVCKDTGDWDWGKWGQLVCAPRGCKPPPGVMNGRFACEEEGGVAHDEVCRLECDFGFERQGKPAKCSFGEYSFGPREYPRCVPRSHCDYDPPQELT